jgi:glycosyltransferase involved in cell wall biosynthesis
MSCIIWDKMKVLWFTNIPLPAVDRHMGRAVKGSGHWMSVLLDALKSEAHIRLAVATAYPGLPDAHFTEDGIEYFVIGQPRRLSHLSFRQRDFNRCKGIVQKWQPSIIHIHGTERFYGLLVKEKDFNIPIIISIQGLLHQLYAYYFGNLSFVNILRGQTLRAFLRGRGWLFDYLRFRHGAKREKTIISSARNFIGRTDWDRSHVKAINKEGRYFHVDELLRSEFYEKEWSIDKISRHSIIFTNARSPLRNVETILQAVALLKKDFPSVKLNLAGFIDLSRNYGRLISEQISKFGLDEYVELLGLLNAEEMVEAIASSHIFCIASLMENSPNSLCEAQLIGMPCVASYAGGIPSLVDEGKTGLFFPPGDAAVLAHRIREIFESDKLAINLGTFARKRALQRHNSDAVVQQLCKAYEAVAR